MSDKNLDTAEDKLWIQYKKTKDIKIRDILIRQYAPLVKYVAGKISIGAPNGVEFEDLVSFGNFGLFDAIEKFDPNINIKFKTYAVTRIRGSIFDELRLIDWVPRSVRQKIKTLDEATKKLESKLNRSPTSEEIAQELDISINDLKKMMTKVSGTSIASLSDNWSSSDNDKSILENSIEGSKDYNPDYKIEEEEVKKVLKEFLLELPEKEKKVLYLYYYKDLTLKEIGKALNVTESRISQLHTKGIARLKSKIYNLKKGLT